MKTTMHLALLITLFAITFVSCKKDKADAPQRNCLITNIAVADNLIITYNNEDKIASMKVGSSTTTFLYSGNTVVKTTLNNGTFSSKSIITIGANDFASNVRTETNMAGTNFFNRAYEYNGQELTKEIFTSSANNTVSTATYTYSGGNLVSSNGNGMTTTYEYYDNQLSQKGDYFDFLNLSVGYNVFKSKNSLKSIKTGNTIKSYEYIFDALRKIITLKESTASGATNYAFQYTCP